MFVTYIKNRDNFVVGIGSTKAESVADVTCFAMDWDRVRTSRWSKAPQYVQTKALAKLDSLRASYWAVAK